jgi:hypothetical protein
MCFSSHNTNLMEQPESTIRVVARVNDSYGGSGRGVLAGITGFVQHLTIAFEQYGC